MPPLNENLVPPNTPAEAAPSEDKAALDYFSRICSHPKVKQAILEAQATDEPGAIRPKGWRVSSNAPYYRERFAAEIREVLDAMYHDGQDREYRYADYKRMNKTSLYLRINQSLRYLIEPENKMDPDGKYRTMNQLIVVTREKNGIRISFAKDIRDAESGFEFKPRIVVAKELETKWRSELNEFLVEAKAGQVFERTKCCLSDEEVAELKAQIFCLEGFIGSVTNDKIKVVKSEE